MRDVCLLGSGAIDEILYVRELRCGENNLAEKSELRLGGLFNMLPALKGMDIMIVPVVGIENQTDFTPLVPEGVPVSPVVVPGRTPFAHIVIHGPNRTSIVEWGAGHDGSTIAAVPAKWTHIAYLDVLSNLDMKKIKDASRVLSGDLCLSNPTPEECENVVEYAKYLNVLFISDAELNAHCKALGITAKNTVDLAQAYRDHIKVPLLVCHGNNWSILCALGSDPDYYSSPEKVYDVDSTGAGDMFAASFIRHIVTLCTGVNEARAFAHKNTTELLRRRHLEAV